MPDLLDRLKATISDRYRIERELGRGGMAIVFLAQDLKHRRLVALKVLQPELAHAIGPERFLQEIEIAAQLSHPYILPLHDSGEADGLLYYVMPYVEGESLRDRLDRERHLPLEDALQILEDVADALSHAHSLGVIHRDIKPENIMFQAGHAVVSDFGIARAVDVAGGERLTETGLAVGTPAYMSPEQASGTAAVDARSDLYSLACVAYEMLGGEPPFTGPTPQAVMARHALDPVPRLQTLRPTVSDNVERALEKALAKVPADRFGTAVQFAEGLEQAFTAGAGFAERLRRRVRPRTLSLAAVLAIGLVGGTWWISKAFPGVAAAGIESLAVLPFENLSGDPEQEYFVAGMHDALIGQLGQIGALRVISRRSAIQYKDSGKPIPEIARDLNVDGIVDASVVTAGDTVRIQVRLIEALPEERHLWAQAYERPRSEVLAMHSDVARAIAREIGVGLTPQEEMRLAGARPVDPDTYEAYLKGMYYLNKFTPEDRVTGLAYLHEAVDRSPGDPLAYAGLALGYATLGHSPVAPPDAWRRARAAAERALRLDSMLAEAHAAMADIKTYYEWDWEGAERAFLRANELNPNLAMNHYHYAWYLSLFGRLDEAIVEHKRAEELDPLTPPMVAWLGGLYRQAGRHDDAIAQARKALELSADNAIGLLVLGNAYADKGMYEEAIAAHEKMATVSPSWRWALATTYAVAGRTDEARDILAELEALEATPFGSLGMAVLYTALGEEDEAFRWLSYEPPHAFLPWIRVQPRLEPLRDDPRFQDLLRRMNLPD